MRKSYGLEELDCANCAAKLENAVKKIEGVNDARVDFILQKLTLDAEDEVFDAVLGKAVEVFKRVEPDCRIVV